ncbi:hypothetical protein I4F81_003748 [Pyropia yezoensis]|uniref:Uncharacterized protein n=1 Tax=Pyropia yezoensis TaxID=2788 RepID=A0ACC3BT78_PYRYE|nr:hypothetical protein I4F81_003748 [Neopyropia yezoensis]
MAATEAATRKTTSSFTPACDAHLPRKNSHARRKPVATNIVTHVQRMVAVAIWRLARHVAHSWWRYLPFLIAVLRRGVDKLYALVPGTSVALYWYGTVSLAMLARIVKRLLPTDAALVGDVAEYGAAAIEKRVRGGPIGSRSSTVGSDMRADNAG